MNHLLAGFLGNPGNKYAKTRHNVAWRFLEVLKKEYGLDEKEEKTFSQATIKTEFHTVHFVRPLEFMNLSGKAISKISNLYKIDISKILIVHDELDLEFGVVKNKIGGGSAGNNGIKDIIEKLGNPGFARLRLGIGKPPKDSPIDVGDYVLMNFTSEEELNLPSIFESAKTKFQEWIRIQDLQHGKRT